MNRSRSATCVVLALLAALSACAGELERGCEALEAGRIREARSILEPLAREGDAVALCAIAWLEEDPVTRRRTFRAAAEGGSAPAMFGLYFDGLQRNDVSESLRWLERACDAGMAAACREYAGLHRNGDRVPVLCERALDYARRAAEMGDVGAQEDYARWLLIGDCATGDGAEAAHWARRAAMSGSESAAHFLAGLYARGIGVEHDAFETVVWLEVGGEGTTRDPGPLSPEELERARRRAAVIRARIELPPPAPSVFRCCP